MRRVVREALAGGWRWDGFTGTTHCRITWPKSGESLTFGTTPSVASWKSLATEIKRASGVETWRKGNRKRSRKKVQTSGFSLDAARREQSTWHRQYDADLDAMRARHASLVDEMRADAASGRRDRICAIAAKLREVQGIEARIADEFHQPVERFDPHDLTP